MTLRLFTVLVVLLCLALSAVTRAQEDESLTEQDARITSAEDRQRRSFLEARAMELRRSEQLVEAVRTLNRVGRFQVRMFVADRPSPPLNKD